MKSVDVCFKRYKKGFTLIELLAVIVILAIIAIIAITIIHALNFLLLHLILYL